MEIQFILPVPGHREWRLQSGIRDPITRLCLGCVALGKLLLISQAFLNKAELGQPSVEVAGRRWAPGVTLRFQPSDAPHRDGASPARLCGPREPRDGAVGPCREPGTAHGACAACRATGGRPTSPSPAPPRPRAPSAAVPPAACGVAARQSGRLGACRALPRARAPTDPRSPGRRGCKPAVAPSPRPDPPSDALLREIFLCCFAFVSLVWRQQEGRGLVDSLRWPDHRGRGVTLGAAGPYRGLRCGPMLATFATFAFEQMQMLPCKIQKA